MSNEKEQRLNLELPVMYVQTEDCYVMWSDNETDKLLDIPVVVQADSKEAAIKQFWISVKCNQEFYRYIYRRHQRWALFDKGPWVRGGRWFSVLGFHFNFRVGKNMKGGVYVPFTKLNISFTSFWRKKYSPEKNKK